MLRKNVAVFLTLSFFSGYMTGCNEDFRAQSDLEGLEVLAIQASPPSVEIGESSTLQALVFSEDEQPSYVWSVCLFDTGPFNAFSCVDPALECCLGDEKSAELSADVFINCNQDCIEDNEGTEENAFPIPDLSTDEGMAMLSELEEVRVRLRVTAGGASIEAVKSVTLHKEGVKNTNPVFGELTYEGPACDADEPCVWPESTVITVDPGVTLKLATTIDPGESEEEADQLEASSVAWFTAGGAINELFSSGEKAENQLRIPEELELEDDKIQLWLVARDGIGGASWLSRTLKVNITSEQQEEE